MPPPCPGASLVTNPQSRIGIELTAWAGALGINGAPRFLAHFARQGHAAGLILVGALHAQQRTDHRNNHLPWHSAGIAQPSPFTLGLMKIHAKRSAASAALLAWTEGCSGWGHG